MQVNVEVDCTPEEARRFLGLPDVTKANEAYVDALTKAMSGMGSIDQLQEFMKQVSPIGQIGMTMFEQFMAGGLGKGKSGG